MLTNSSFFKYCASIFNIMCGSWAFHSAKLYLIIAGNKNIYTFHYLHTVWKVNIFLGETQNGMKNAFSVSQ